MQSPPLYSLLIAAVLAASSAQARAQDPQPAEPDPAPAEEPREGEPRKPVEGPRDGDVKPSGPLLRRGVTGPAAVDEPGEQFQLSDADEPTPEAAAASSTGSTAAPADVKRLQLDDAIEMALRRHPQLVSARQQVLAAEARVGQAQSRYYPRIDGWLQYLRASENGSLAASFSVPGLSRVGGSIRDGVEPYHSFNNFLAAVIVQQLIYDFGRTQGAVGAQRAFVKAAKMNEEMVKQTVTFGVMQAFFAVHAARQAVRVADDTLKTTLNVLELAEASHRAGMRPPSEKARAEADVAAAEVRLIRAKVSLDIARARVANAIGAAGESFEPADDPMSAAIVPSEDHSIEVALKNRPELRALDFQREGLKQNLRSVRARQFPTINALAGVNSRGQFLTGAGQDPYNRFNWNAGVLINVPIFQGLLVRKLKDELKAEIGSLDGGQEAIRQAVILEVKQALAAVHAADAAELASKRGVEAARVALETLEGRYRDGLAKLVELTDVQDAYLSARSQVVQATYDRYLARAVLSLAMGNTRPLR